MHYGIWNPISYQYGTTVTQEKNWDMGLALQLLWYVPLVAVANWFDNTTNNTHYMWGHWPAIQLYHKCKQKLYHHKCLHNFTLTCIGLQLCYLLILIKKGLSTTLNQLLIWCSCAEMQKMKHSRLYKYRYHRWTILKLW